MKTFYRSFAGGEITPEMFARLDLSKFQTGLKLCRNFRTLAHGPAARRPGFKYHLMAKVTSQRVRLIPFVYSADQAVILEFGDSYVRFHNKDGTLLEANQAVVSATNANPAVIEITGHGYADDDWVFSTFTDGMEELTGRFFQVDNATTDTFTLKDLYGVAVSGVGLSAYVSGGTFARVYTLASPYTPSQLADIKFAQNSDVLTLTHPSVATRELRRLGATNWQFSTVSFVPSLAVPTGVGAVATVAVATNLTTQTYLVTAVASDLVTESLASSQASCSNNLTLAGNFNTISWSASVGAARYYVYKKRGGVFGFIGQTTTLSLVDDNIEADTLISPPENLITLNTGATDYPSAVTYYERRRWFAAPTAKPQSLFATRNATESNLTSSIPSRADDALEFRIAAQQQNAIRHLIPLTDLIALTAGGHFRIFADGGPALEIATLSVKPQGFGGAANVTPALTESSALYVQAQGSRVRELAYDSSGQGAFRSIDVSLLAPHLFDGYTIREMAFVRAPEATLWVVRSDGVLLGLTYVPDQQVFAWHQHDTDGVFESCAVIPEDNEDVLYVVVQRTINGQVLRYIERATPRQYGALEDAFFVDAGLTYDGVETATVNGLHHLVGKDVQVLADGAVVTGKTVAADGSLELDVAASKVTVGLGYISDLTTLPLALERVEAAGQGMTKNVNQVFLKVAGASIVKAGPSFSELRENPARAVDDPYDSAPALVIDGEIALSIDGDWSDTGSVYLRQDLPLPMTVVGMALDVALGD